MGESGGDAVGGALPPPRAAWYTPANLERYYVVAADMLVDAGIVRRVEGFDRTEE
jgi:hypothetical protein